MKRPQSIQINIPQPCHEDWDKMTPQEQGRFCDSCQKCVVDYRWHSDEQLLEALGNSSNQNTCGRFRASQLDRVIFRPGKRSRYYQWFLSLAFIVFLQQLFGTDANAQTPVQTEQTEDKMVHGYRWGTVSGSVNNEKDEPLVNATVQIFNRQNICVGGAVTDFDGNYIIKPVSAGHYDINITYDGYKQTVIKSVLVQPDRTALVNANLIQQSQEQDTATTVMEYVIPLIEPQPSVKVSEEIEVMGGMSHGNKFTPAVYRGDDGFVNTIGARGDSTLYIIDAPKKREKDKKGTDIDLEHGGTKKTIRSDEIERGAW